MSELVFFVLPGDRSTVKYKKRRDIRGECLKEGRLKRLGGGVDTKRGWRSRKVLEEQETRKESEGTERKVTEMKGERGN